MERDTMFVPCIGQTSYKNGLTVVVLAWQSDIVENISEALQRIHNKGGFLWQMLIVRCLDLEKLNDQFGMAGRIGIDFIVIALDLSNVFCIEWTKAMLKKVHPDLRMRRVVLVNPCEFYVNSMAVKCSDVLTFCKENKLELINANISKRDEADFLAQRLLNYFGASIGFKTGLPNLNI